MSEPEKILVRMDLDFRRMGRLTGVFITTEEKRQSLRDREVYFGEVLGKHSECVWTFDAADLDKDLKVVSTDQEFIWKAADVFGASQSGTLTGHNPLTYEFCDEENDSADEV